jgi:Glycosyl transferases group 1
VRIAYIDHSYHAQTRSTAFLVNLLQELAAVDVYFDDGWLGRDNVDLSEILDREYDVIVLFQVERHAKPLNDSSARVIFVPMYDSCLPFPDIFWKELTRLEILCFCRQLYERLDAWGLRARYVQFFPEIARFEVNPTAEPAGFFWCRRPEPSWQTVKMLLGKSQLSWINIHRAKNPLDAGPLALSPGDEARYQLRFTEWSEDRTAYTRALHEAGIFFAPRLQEGIGMAFLESMAMGKAVVAADNPTMNEYITHQVNGYLFDPVNPTPLDLSRFREIGRAARQSMERGSFRWERSKRALAEWITTGTWPAQRTARSVPSRDAAMVSVILLPTRDREASEQTRLSVETQSHALVEQIAANAQRGIHTAEILNRAASTATGEWLIFLRAGTVFLDENVLAEALENAPNDADFITCHYLEQCDGRELMRRVADFNYAIDAFRTGRLDRPWFNALPVLSATLIHKRLFERAGFSPRLRLAADIDFFLRCKRAGATFQHGNTILSRIRAYDVDNALLRTSECRKVFLAEGKNQAIANALCSSLEQAKCDPLLDAWARLGALSLGANLVRHPAVARYAMGRAWRRLRILGVRGFLLRQFLWIRSRMHLQGGSSLH